MCLTANIYLWVMSLLPHGWYAALNEIYQKQKILLFFCNGIVYLLFEETDNFLRWENDKSVFPSSKSYAITSYEMNMVNWIFCRKSKQKKK